MSAEAEASHSTTLPGNTKSAFTPKQSTRFNIDSPAPEVAPEVNPDTPSRK
jgi:hypothetical protein